MAPKGESIAFFVTEINSLMIILDKDGEQRGRDCVIPRSVYVPKGVTTFILL